MRIFHALFNDSKKRIGILILLLTFVNVAIYLMVSLNYSKYIIQDEISNRNLPHTLINYSLGYFSDEELEYFQNDPSFITVEDRIINYLDENDLKYQKVETILVNSDLKLETYHGDNYKVLEGKSLESLGPMEVAITKEYAYKLGSDPLGQVIDLYYGGSLEVVSIIEYPNYELAYNPLETLSDIGLFSESGYAPGIIVQDTLKILKVKEGEYLAALYPEYGFGVAESRNALLKIYYDEFSFDAEQKLLSHIATYQNNWHIEGNIGDVDSLGVLTRSNPLPEMLKATLSTFVVSGIVISSVYAFYIHFKNQLHQNARAIATFSLIGVKRKYIVQAYLKLFGIIYILASLFLILAAFLLRSILKFTFRTILITLGLSTIFLMIVVAMFYTILWSWLRESHGLLKSGGFSFIHMGKLKQGIMILLLGLKRIAMMFKLVLGFAFSIGLSAAIVLMSASALTSVSNIYHPKTLGLEFDYILISPTIDVYVDILDQGMDAAQVYKQTNRMYLDYTIYNPVNNVTRGSVITIYDNLEPFITLDKGELPPHSSTFEGEGGTSFERIEALASKRIMDVNDLHVYSDPEGPVDKHYLFFKENLGSYEHGIPVRGSFPTLLDRGFVSIDYQKLMLSAQINLDYPVMDTIVKINEVMSPEAFETYLSDRDIEYIAMPQILDEFEAVNEKINQDSFNILAVIIVAMLFQVVVNLSGVLVQIKEYKETEEFYLGRVGVRKHLLKRVNMIDILVRVILSILVMLVVVGIFLPMLNYALKQTYAILWLPKTLLAPIMLGGVVALILILGILLLSSRYRMKGEN